MCISRPSGTSQFRPQAVQFLQMDSEIPQSAAPATPADRAISPNPTHPVTLAIDIGGSGLKAMLLDVAGAQASERLRIATPAMATPEAVLAGLDELLRLLPGFDRVSVGFPGIVKRGMTFWPTTCIPIGQVSPCKTS